jgi:hypothetical protein
MKAEDKKCKSTESCTLCASNLLANCMKYALSIRYDINEVELVRKRGLSDIIATYKRKRSKWRTSDGEMNER